MKTQQSYHGGGDLQPSKTIDSGQHDCQQFLNFQ